MENVDADYKVLDKGILQLLGKENYPPGEKAPEPCVHVSDGFIYNRGDSNESIIALLQCVRCGIQYEVWKATGAIL